jgi:hypothetical protein
MVIFSRQTLVGSRCIPCYLEREGSDSEALLALREPEIVAAQLEGQLKFIVHTYGRHLL